MTSEKKQQELLEHIAEEIATKDLSPQTQRELLTRAKLVREVLKDQE